MVIATFTEEPETVDLCKALRRHFNDEVAEIFNDGFNLENGSVVPYTVEERTYYVGSEDYQIWELKVKTTKVVACSLGREIWTRVLTDEEIREFQDEFSLYDYDSGEPIPYID